MRLKGGARAPHSKRVGARFDGSYITTELPPCQEGFGIRSRAKNLNAKFTVGLRCGVAGKMDFIRDEARSGASMSNGGTKTGADM